MSIEAGSKTVVIGANGAGKSRLGALIEAMLPPTLVQRIGAQKSLTINDQLMLISEERAERALRYGYADGGAEYRQGHRWGGKPTSHLLNDYDALLQRLFAEQNRAAVKFCADTRAGHAAALPDTTLAKLEKIWNALLPHRQLRSLDASLSVSVPLQPHAVHQSGLANVPTSAEYKGPDMSDGERAIVYYLGQCLVAPKDSVLILDEPEGHIHKAILGRLWDAIEAARPDCAFIYITHDLYFGAERSASAKYFVRNYERLNSEAWDIEPLPEGTGLPEHVVAELVGSRKPILFVEGAENSLDLTVYRCFYKEHTIMPVGSCETVIRSVRNYRLNAALHRLGAVCGLVDADGRDTVEMLGLQTDGVHALPVSEVENLFLLPPVFLALAQKFSVPDPPGALQALTQSLVADLKRDLDATILRHTLRELDRRLKRVNLQAQTLDHLEQQFTTEIAHLQVGVIQQQLKDKMLAGIATDDLSVILRWYENKGGVLARLAHHLGLQTRFLKDRLTYLLSNPEGLIIQRALESVLPKVPT